jgi:hypothetical protein
MALVTGGFTTYTAKGNREDLSNVIYNISPADTPFMSAVGKNKASNVLHEWQTDSLAAAVTTNASLEGDAITGSTSSPTTRNVNYCQIFTKDVVVTGTQQAATSAGRSDELAYQLAKRSKEIKRDMEATITGNQGYVAGDSTTARKLRSLESWLTTNDSRGTGGADATAATAAATDATAGNMRTFTETILKSVIQSVYTAGGEPSLLMVGPVNKQRVSDFTGRASARQAVSEAKILGAASLYASDFGDLKVIPNRFQRERSAFVLDPEYAAISYYRPFTTFELAKVGDAERRALIVECTLEMRNEAAHGVAADLTTT